MVTHLQAAVGSVDELGASGGDSYSQALLLYRPCKYESLNRHNCQYGSGCRFDHLAPLDRQLLELRFIQVRQGKPFCSM